MARSKILISDEATTALGATPEVEFVKLLKELQCDIGCATLFVTNHLTVVEELCDDLEVMYQGNICECSSRTLKKSLIIKLPKPAGYGQATERHCEKPGEILRMYVSLCPQAHRLTSQ